MKFIDGLIFVDLADSIFAMGNGSETYYPYPNTFNSNSEGIVYTHMNMVANLFPLLKNTGKKYILITHNWDAVISEELYSQLPSNVIKWYSPSIAFRGEKLEGLPWGIETLQRFEFHHTDKRLKMTQKILEPKTHRNLVYVNHSVWTCRKERFLPYVLLKDKSFATVHFPNLFDFDTYIDNIYNHKFVLSPPGHAIDSHRTWEALYLNSIPIEKRNNNNYFWRDLPICFVDDWEEVTEDFLNKEYERITQTKWNLQKLTPEYWRDKILSEKDKWKPVLYSTVQKPQSTIFHPPYQTFCEQASKDNAIFSTFRRSGAYRTVVENFTYEMGSKYLEVIEEENPKMLESIDRFRKNDQVGFPYIYFYEKYGNWCPTTLQYIKILSDLIKIFGILDGMDIFEFGAGYGGQCCIISEMFNFKSYTIVDLPTVIELPKKYLAEMGIFNTNCITIDELADKNYDLFLSNYAFTEIDASLQQFYLDKVINKCKHGYITCNIVSEDTGKPYSFDELFSKIKHSYKVSPRTPKLDDTTLLLTW